MMMAAMARINWHGDNAVPSYDYCTIEVVFQYDVETTSQKRRCDILACTYGAAWGPIFKKS